MKKYLPALWRIVIALFSSILLLILVLYSYEGMSFNEQPSHAALDVWELSELVSSTAKSNRKDQLFCSPTAVLHRVRTSANNVPFLIASAVALRNTPQIACIPYWLANDLVKRGIISGTGRRCPDEKLSHFVVDGDLSSFPFIEMKLSVGVSGSFLPQSLKGNVQEKEFSVLIDAMKKASESGRGFHHNLASNPYILALIVSSLQSEKDIQDLLDVLAHSGVIGERAINLDFGFSTDASTQMRFLLNVNGVAICEHFGIVKFGESGNFDLGSYANSLIRTRKISDSQFISQLVSPEGFSAVTMPNNRMDSLLLNRISVECNWLQIGKKTTAKYFSEGK